MDTAARTPEDAESVLPPEGALREPSRRDWTELLQSLITIIIIAIFLITFILQAFEIPSGSMENTLLVGDYVLVDKFTYSPFDVWDHFLPYHKVHHGDIIVFRWPVHPEEHFVKRVIGLPGDRVRLIHGSVFINGKAIHDASAVHKMDNHDAYRDEFPSTVGGGGNVTPNWRTDIPYFIHDNELVVPEDCYFVLGDNRDESSDSRYWGFVPKENIVGKPLMVYFSMRRSDDTLPPATTGGKIERFAEDLWKIPARARWDRTLHFVR